MLLIYFIFSHFDKKKKKENYFPRVVTMWECCKGLSRWLEGVNDYIASLKSVCSVTTCFTQFNLFAKQNKKAQLSVLQACDIVPGSVGGVASCGGLAGGLTLLRAGGSSRVGQGGGLLSSRIRGVPIAKLALHPHLQKLNRRGEMSQRGAFTTALNTCNR